MILKKRNNELKSYDTEVPFRFDVEEFKNAENIFKADDLGYIFYSQFSLGIQDYMQFDYANTISIFGKLESQALQLTNNLEWNVIKKWIRELYFYLGLSIVAISMSKIYKNHPQLSRSYVGKASLHLARSESLANVNNYKDRDRDLYFLSIALVMKGRKDIALTKLADIKPADEFYDKAQRLIYEILNK